MTTNNRQQTTTNDNNQHHRSTTSLVNNVIGQQRHRSTTPTMAPRKGWRGSKAKLQLQRDLITGFVSLDKTMKAQEVHSKRAVYQQFPLQQFADRLRDMRKRIGAMKEAAFNDNAALQHDRLLYPTATHDLVGRPWWEGSDAERLLAEDMENELHKAWKPKKMWLSRSEYTVFELKRFRDHIYQAQKTKIFRGYQQDKNGKNDAELEE